ncbi:SRPBCC family protein [Streptomyces sp. NBC_01304]|uniref:SRPBCC family protein n=1 Tax=Streptomyces sp. NBC_01304 TaxID=2903818 RepID=UPI002E139F82|nr:SRPBCC family protein [Streptomyces sp. NBC_01304]
MPDTKNPLASVAGSAAADRVKAELQDYLAAQAQRLLIGAGRKLGDTTLKLNDIAEGKSPGFAKLALDGGRKLAEGKGPLRSAVELGAGRLKDTVKDKLKGLGKGGGRKKGGGKKPVVILEYVDVGVPLRVAYDQWTQFQEFSTFAKGVRSVSRAGDTDSDWQLKIFWSSRSWKAHTTDQVPDDRIAWTSEGAKGTTKGVVSFHEMAENLTRIVLIVEYYPKGLFEKTGNIWRAQGRRTRLDLKHFARFVSLRGEATDSWRGEIRDGEVVTTHEEAMEAEEAEGVEEGEERDTASDEFEEDEEPEDFDESESEAEGEGESEAEDEFEEEAEEEEEEPEQDEELEYEDDVEEKEQELERQGRSGR